MHIRKAQPRDGASLAAIYNHYIVNRRVFFDFTVSPPKSVSLVAFLGDDRRIIDAHERAIRVMVKEFEAFAAARIRTNGQTVDRLTGNVCAALFTQTTSDFRDVTTRQLRTFFQQLFQGGVDLGIPFRKSITKLGWHSRNFEIAPGLIANSVAETNQFPRQFMVVGIFGILAGAQQLVVLQGFPTIFSFVERRIEDDAMRVQVRI